MLGPEIGAGADTLAGQEVLAVLAPTLGLLGRSRNQVDNIFLDLGGCEYVAKFIAIEVVFLHHHVDKRSDLGLVEIHGIRGRNGNQDAENGGRQD